MAITSKEIAELAGVSRGTVDRALKGREGVNPKTKERILKSQRRTTISRILSERHWYIPTALCLLRLL